MEEWDRLDFVKIAVKWIFVKFIYNYENMKRLLTNANIGDLFMNREGNICIFVGYDKETKLYKYWFRLLGEHEIWKQELEELKELGLSEKIKLNDKLIRTYSYRGDWNSGYVIAGRNYWKSNLDIINKVEC